MLAAMQYPLITKNKGTPRSICQTSHTTSRRAHNHSEAPEPSTQIKP